MWKAGLDIGSTTIKSLGTRMGEGCLSNHIAGKGMFSRIRTFYPDASITPIDYDPSAAGSIRKTASN